MNTRGYVPVAEVSTKDLSVIGVKHVPASQAARLLPDGRVRLGRHHTEAGEIPLRLAEQMASRLPAVVRRDPRERYRATLNRLSMDALTAYRKTGRITWPKSVEDELKVIAWKEGDPSLTAFGGVDQLHRQIEALTRHIVQTGEMQQKAQDHKRVTLNWAGH